MQLIDNINQLLGQDLKANLKAASKLRIAASTFSIYAYAALKEEFEAIESLEFIFTEPTFVTNKNTDNLKKEQREFYIPKLNRENSLYGSEFEIQLRNKLNQRAIAKECADWIRSKVNFKTNKTNQPMQSFLHVSNPLQHHLYAPLQGFTAVDLGYQKGNAISNFVNRIDGKENTQQYLTLFNSIWNDEEKLQEVTQSVAEHIEAVYQENSPQHIYFIMLYHIFKEFLEDVDEDFLPNDRTGYQDSLVWQKLFNFQRDAATGIINKLETYNGCILADSVGLGKTFTALAVIKYYELRNKSVLVLVPKKLAENWLTYNRNLVTNIFAKDRFNYDVLCHTDLTRTSGESLGTPLSQVNWGNYDLVVIDESHNFRNNEAVKEHETRYQALLNKVIRSGVKTKVLMLSATPVNNRFNDLRNQLALAYEGGSTEISKKLGLQTSVEQVFKEAQTVFNRWSELPAENRTSQAILSMLNFDFFKLLDSVTIARSRSHIQQYYDTTDIGQFPERKKPLTFHVPITHDADVIKLDDIYTRLTKLNLSIYAPMSFLLPSRISKYEALYDTQVESGGGKFRQVDREKSLKALVTTNLLKRLESSVHSFRLTLQSLDGNIEETLSTIYAFENRVQNLSAQVAEANSFYSASSYNEEDFDDDIPQTVGKKVQIDLNDLDLPTWKFDLEEDLAVLSALLVHINRITPDKDAKLQRLVELVTQKVENPINPNNKKVLVFSAFSDTTKYLYEHLSQHPKLAKYNLHFAEVNGTDNPRSTLRAGRRGYSFQDVLTLFSPISKSKAQLLPNEPEDIDILIATDCISEGQNLQDCDYLVNYDIHWNPVRIVQRFGRIDRIGSKNTKIQLVNYWPDISLDEYINLKERVENRMAIVDMAATGDDNLLDSDAEDAIYRKKQLEKLQNEVIDLEDTKAGISITDLGLNEFRMDVLNYIKAGNKLDNAPKGLHAVIPADPSVGLQPGVVFALKNLNTTKQVDENNRLHPYCLVYMGENGEVVASHHDTKKLLDKVRSACKNQETPIYSAYTRFNKRTDDGRKMESTSALLNDAIGSMIELKQEADLDSLFTGKTTLLEDDIQELDDFELLGFIVVEG